MKIGRSCCTAAALLLDRVTTAPPARAALVTPNGASRRGSANDRSGTQATELTPFATTLSPALLSVPYVPEIVAVTVLETEVVAVNVAVVEFAGTVTLAGT